MLQEREGELSSHKPYHKSSQKDIHYLNVLSFDEGSSTTTVLHSKRVDFLYKLAYRLSFT